MRQFLYQIDISGSKGEGKDAGESEPVISEEGLFLTAEINPHFDSTVSIASKLARSK